MVQSAATVAEASGGRRENETHLELGDMTRGGGGGGLGGRMRRMGRWSEVSQA